MFFESKKPIARQLTKYVHQQDDILQKTHLPFIDDGNRLAQETFQEN